MAFSAIAAYSQGHGSPTRRSALAKLRSWRASLLRQRAQYLGNVETPAEAAAAGQFGLTAEQRLRWTVRAEDDAEQTVEGHKESPATGGDGAEEFARRILSAREYLKQGEGCERFPLYGGHGGLPSLNGDCAPNHCDCSMLSIADLGGTCRCSHLSAPLAEKGAVAQGMAISVARPGRLRAESGGGWGLPRTTPDVANHVMVEVGSTGGRRMPTSVSISPRG
jgi:hypothetical protein